MYSPGLGANSTTFHSPGSGAKSMTLHSPGSGANSTTLHSPGLCATYTMSHYPGPGATYMTSHSPGLGTNSQLHNVAIPGPGANSTTLDSLGGTSKTWHYPSPGANSRASHTAPSPTPRHGPLPPGPSSARLDGGAPLLRALVPTGGQSRPSAESRRRIPRGPSLCPCDPPFMSPGVRSSSPRGPCPSPRPSVPRRPSWHIVAPHHGRPIRHHSPNARPSPRMPFGVPCPV